MGGKIRGVSLVKMHYHGVYVKSYGIQQQRHGIIELDRYASLSPTFTHSLGQLSTGSLCSCSVKRIENSVQGWQLL